MKRLTERTDIGDSPLDEIAFINPDDAEGLYNLRDIAKYGSDELLYEIANRLAEYEDMEEQGLLVRLPCKVGDTVYDISEFVEGIPCPEMYEFHTDYIGIRKSDDGKTVISLDFMDYYMDDFGRIVFTSREEAEKALED